MKRIDILKEAHKLLKKIYAKPGICVAIVEVFESKGIFITCKEIPDYFPLFTLENAKRFGAKKGLFWWDYNYGLFSGRRRFMRWLMKQYKNDKEEII